MNKLYSKLVLDTNAKSFTSRLLCDVSQKTFVLTFVQNYASRTKVEHIGVLDQCKSDTSYDFGQTFFHKVFAYRGIILHPWTAHLYERNRDVITAAKRQDENGSAKKCIPKLETYYQVLVDARDSVQLGCHSSETVTLLLNSRSDNKPLLHSISGIDYVSHEDIIPYTSCEETPIQHSLFEKFFENGSKKSILKPTEMFSAWQKKNHICLELINVYRETTDHIRVTAIPFFLGADKPPNQVRRAEYWWRYSVRIENLSGFNAQLRETYWRTICNGTVNTRRGVGIMGHEPLLTSDQPAFQLSAKPFSLSTSTGQIWGTFRLEREDGEQFDVRIPAFSLDSRSSPDAELKPIDE